MSNDAKETKDGGPAFPQGTLDATDRYRQTTAAACCGISRREYFAAFALAGLSRAYVEGTVDDYRRENVADDAFKLADAMIAARDAKAVQS